MKRDERPRAHFVGGDGIAACGAPVSGVEHDGFLCQQCEKFVLGLMSDLGLERRPPRFGKTVTVLEFIKEEK